jgi:hypothetical protein
MMSRNSRSVVGRPVRGLGRERGATAGFALMRFALVEDNPVLFDEKIGSTVCTMLRMSLTLLVSLTSIGSDD